MNLPSFRELSKEQDKIYNLPLTSNYLITGPPGTGKTVIALYRASMYKKQRQTPIILSLSKLLSSYMAEAAGSLEIKGLIQTYHSWVSKTYLGYFGVRPPKISDYVFDWERMTPKLFERIMEDEPYLLIDEGQDLPKEFYAAASLMAKNLTIFADENQRITDTQSTFDDIRFQAGIESEHEHRLTRNYRNTKQIAEVADCFYAGLPNGKPDIPVKEGPLPIVQNTKDLEDAINLICRFERNFPDYKIGIFTKYVASQRALREMLSGKTKNPVDAYNSKDRILPSFSTAGIKFVTFQSAKGLEFDAVFLPELQAITIDLQNRDDKMMFYVLLSRAREYLYMLYSGTRKPALFNQIPGELVEFRKS